MDGVSAEQWGEIVGNILREVYDVIPNCPDITPMIESIAPTAEQITFNYYKGYRFTPGFTAENVDYFNNKWSFRPGDVFTSSYLKTGTTWMRSIVANLLYKDEPETLKLANKFSIYHDYLSMSTPLRFTLLDMLPLKRRYMSSHMPATVLNMDKVFNSGAKVIYIIRNPKDQAISWFNMAKRLRYFNGPGYLATLYPDDLNAFVEQHVKNQGLFVREGECYLDHILTWLPYLSNSNFKLIHFEDMKRDPKAAIKEIADFIDVDINEEELEKIAQITSFTAMKERGGEILGEKFFRKGKVGDWKNHLSMEVSDLIDEKVEEKLAGTGITFTYEL